MPNDKLPCPRCGLVRTIFQGKSMNRSGYCMDCKTQRGQDSVSRTWMDDAACATVDPELWFPSEEDDWRPTRDAKEICASCPVRDLCLADAPAWDRWSIRGGQTATERRRKAVA
jgi:WhiB family redox-sensing transcriptional regulator